MSRKCFIKCLCLVAALHLWMALFLPPLSWSSVCLSVILTQVTRLLYGFLVQSNNSWFQQIIPPELVSHLGKFVENIGLIHPWPAGGVYMARGSRYGPDCCFFFPKKKFLSCLLVNRPTNFYVGVTQQSSEPTLLVQQLLANLTGSVVNVTQENCVNQRENEDDKESKHVWFMVNLCFLCPKPFYVLRK